MNQLLKIPAVVLSLSLVFILGACLIILSIWVGPYGEARQALDQGQLEESLGLFARVEQRFDSMAFTRQLLPEIYTDSIANQFYILYVLGEYDGLLEKSATSPVLPAVHFWTGNALFRRAGAVTEIQEQIAWLERASEEYLSVIELDPDNWDAKYNYELTGRLIDELKEEKETPPQMLEILRPRPRQGEPPFQQTG